MTDLENVMAFVRSIGIPCSHRAGASGFVPGVRIVDGGMHVDPDAAAVEDVLHETAHLAIMPPIYRAVANDDLEASFVAMDADLGAGRFEQDSSMMRAILQCGDAEATAWAWAAGLHLGIAPQLIISQSSYSGSGSLIRKQLQLNAYLGINGLWHAGMCSTKHRPGRKFPDLAHWTQTAGDREEDCKSPHAQWSADPVTRRSEMERAT